MMKKNIHEFPSSFPMTVIDIHQAAVGIEQPIPFFSTSVPAGYPSPADEYVDSHLDLNDFMVKHPSATFFVRVEGESMRDAGILSGDMLVVDRSLTPSHGRIVVAIVDGEFTVKRILIEENEVYLAPENAAFTTMKINPECQFQVWGVVTYVIHKPQ